MSLSGKSPSKSILFMGNVLRKKPRLEDPLSPCRGGTWDQRSKPSKSQDTASESWNGLCPDAIVHLCALFRPVLRPSPPSAACSWLISSKLNSGVPLFWRDGLDRCLFSRLTWVCLSLRIRQCTSRVYGQSLNPQHIRQYLAHSRCCTWIYIMWIP